MSRVDTDYETESESVIQRLKQQLAKTKQERDELEKQRAARKPAGGEEVNDNVRRALLAMYQVSF